MDATRDPSPRPNSLPPTYPERPEVPKLSELASDAATTQLSRVVLKAPAADELEDTITQPFTAIAAPTPQPRADTVAPRSPDARSARRPPRSDATVREHPARALPGWLALFVLLLSATGTTALLARSGLLPPVDGFPETPSDPATAALDAPALATLAALAALTLFMLVGLLANRSGDARVVSRWGRYRGTVRRTGLVWINPLFRRRRVDVKLRHWRSDPTRVTDCTGTPIVVRLLIVWRVRDTARAVYGVAEHETYLREQVQAVLTRIASTLPCDSNSAPSLRDGQWFADEMTRALAAEVAPAGLDVYSVQPLALDYAPEVADSMRRRRLAELDAGLRTVLVDDAVEAAALAVRRLERATSHELDDETRRSLMEQLLVAFVAPAGVTASVPAPAARTPRREARPA